MRAIPLLSSALLLSGLLAARASAAPRAGLAPVPAPVDAFLCRRASPLPRRAFAHDRPTVTADDHIRRGPARLGRPTRLCEPAALGGSGFVDPALRLLGRTARSPGRQDRHDGTPVETSLGSEAWNLGRSRLVLLPASAAATAPGLDRSYRCYRARPAAAPTSLGPVAVTTAGGESLTLSLGAPRSLCSPAEIESGGMADPAWHLACYAASETGGSGADATRAEAQVSTALGDARVALGPVRELCLPARAIPACNGSRRLCGRRYDEVAYATTHNAMSNEEDGFVGPNQRYSVRRQLADGVRGLMLDIHEDAGEVALCHAFCALGRTPLTDTLADIRAFLLRHPYEVVTIIFESYVSAPRAEEAFAAAGLLDLVHSQPLGAPWPTLEEMIAADRRLVVFTDREGGAFPWYHDVWAYAFETHFSFSTPESMSCDPNRGDPSHSLFILNHFLTHVFGSPELAEQVNHNPFFRDRALRCRDERDTLPNFVTVDFYDIGDVTSVVAMLNR